MMIPTSVTIREDQKEWIEKNYFKLSKFVRDRLDDVILWREEMKLNSIGMYTGTPNNIKEVVNDEMNHECPECGRVFGNVRGLRTHYSQAHPDAREIK